MQFEHDDALRSSLRRARIVKVNDEGTQQLVDLKGLKNEEPKKIFRPQDHGFTSNPPEDTEGVIVQMGGRTDRTMYLDGGHKKYRPRKLPIGASALYNHTGDIIRVFEKNLDVVHSQKINLQIGKGTDVSSNDGSKDADNSGQKNISVVLTGDSMVLTYDDVSVTLASGRITHKAPKVVIDSPQTHLGGDGGTLVGLCGGGCATKVWAI